MPTFERARLDELALVPWLDGPNGRAVAGATGRAQDAELVKLRDAVRMRAPLEAPSDALPYLGRDRMLLQAPGESSSAYAARLDNAHNIWYWAGARDGIVSVFEPFFVDQDFTSASATAPPSSTLIKVWDIASLGGPWWNNGDPSCPWYSKSVVFLDSREGPWATDGAFGDPGTFGDEGLVGSTITERELTYMRQMIRRLKAPGSYPTYIAVVLAGDSTVGFLPNGKETLGDEDGTFGDTDAVAFLRVGHAMGEGVLWGGSPDGTFGDPGDHTTFEV